MILLRRRGIYSAYRPSECADELSPLFLLLSLVAIDLVAAVSGEPRIGFARSGSYSLAVIPITLKNDRRIERAV